MSNAGQPWLKYQSGVGTPSSPAPPPAPSDTAGKPWLKYGIKAKGDYENISPQADAQKQALQQDLVQPKPKPLSPSEESFASQESILRGVPLGSYNEDIRAAGSGAISALQGKGFRSGYQKSRDEQERVLNTYYAEHPALSTAETTLGGLAGTAELPGAAGLAKLPWWGKSAIGSLSAGVGGAVQGFGEGANIDERLENARNGGTMGALLGLVFPAAGAGAKKFGNVFEAHPVAAKLGTSAAAAGVGAATDSDDPLQGAEIAGGATLGGSVLLPRIRNADSWAASYLGRALKRDEVDLATAKGVLSKPGRSLSDLGKQSVIEAGEQAALEGEGRRLGAHLYYDQRMKGREATISSAVDHLVSDQSMYETVDKLITDRALASRPLYESAFAKADSTAVFESHLTNAFNEASKRFNETAGGVHDAENELTLAKAKLHRAGNNVYGVSSANQEIKAAEAKLEAAKIANEQARSNKEIVRDRLQQSQHDASSGARGGIYSNWIGHVIRDPIAKAGLRAGLEVQRVEHLAAMRSDPKIKPFDPTDYAIIGTDKDGDPIVGKVPNLRTLDAMKRGLDSMLYTPLEKGGYLNTDTGRLELDQRGRAIEALRKELVSELDLIAPPEYKQARAAWEGPSTMIAAIHTGRTFAKQDPETIFKYVSGLLPAERDAYKIGVARALNDMITTGGTGAITTAKRLTESTRMGQRVRAALQDDEAADKLIAIAEGEVEDQKRGAAILGGSRTAGRAAAGKEFEEVAPVFDELIAGARAGITGIAASATQQAGRLGSRWIQERLSNMSTARRAALGKLLFSTDRDENIKAIEMIYEAGKEAPTLPWTPRTSVGLTLGASGALNTALDSKHAQQ